MNVPAGLRAAFAAAFGRPPQLTARSPGRVNVIGEHTDYNEGWVLPTALDRGTDLAARRRYDGVLHVVAPRLGATDRVRVDDLRPAQGPGWTRYVRGSVALLQAAGCPPVGADLLIDGDLPLAAGLSSSASVELGVAVVTLALAEATMDPVGLARLGQRVENDIVGVHSGIMDQLVIAGGVAGHALLIDCRRLAVDPVPIPATVRVLVLDSAVPRTLAGSAYNQRRAECEAAVRALRAAAPELTALRDVSQELLAAESGRLDGVTLRRARHVVSENRRVLDGAAALRGGDVEQLGRLMVTSHRSLRDDYEVSGPELDTLVTLALETPGVLGARLTGAGFGGCAVALVRADAAAEAAATIAERYRATTGRAGTASVCTPSAGTRVTWRAETH